MTFQDTIVNVIDTNATKKPSSPQGTHPNPMQKTIFVNFIQLSFDTYFSDKGIVFIKIGNRFVLNQNIVGVYKRLQTLSIPLSDEEFHKNEKITVYAWNGIDNDFVSLGYDIGISEQPDAQTPPDSPLSISQRNQEKSEPLELFSFGIYHEDDLTQPETALIDMKGYKKLIVTMAGSEVQEAEFTTPYTDQNETVNYTIAESGGEGINTPTSDYREAVAILDTQDEESKEIDMDIEAINDTTIGTHNSWQDDGTGNGWDIFDYTIKEQRAITFTVEEDNDIGFSNPSTLFSDISRSTFLSNLPMTTTKRYLRITQKITVTFSFSKSNVGHSNGDSASNPCLTGCGNYNQTYSQHPSDLTNIVNVLTQGGTGFLSFEVKGVGNQWVEFISSDEFGTITQGSSLVRQIGDVVSQSNADKVGFVLPSTQTDFRAKLTVTGGGIQTGVKVLRVS